MKNHHRIYFNDIHVRTVGAYISEHLIWVCEMHSIKLGFDGSEDAWIPNFSFLIAVFNADYGVQFQKAFFSLRLVWIIKPTWSAIQNFFYMHLHNQKHI